MSGNSVLRRARVDGRDAALDAATVGVLDDGFARGDGAFETVGVWDGAPFRLLDHLQRLAASMDAASLPAPDLDALRADVEAVLEGVSVDAVVRVYATGSGTRVVTLEAQPEREAPRRLISQPAPWIRPLGTWALAGVKSMSYLPNMAAGRAAQAAGGDDALLVTLEGFVAEGPTFAVCWMRDGTLHAPAVELGVVDSISRRSVIEAAQDLGVEVVAGRWGLEAALAADEVLVSSAVRPVIALTAIDGHRLPEATPTADQLADVVQQRRRGR
jgi:branched-chain amino acid aminotransferase